MSCFAKKNCLIEFELEIERKVPHWGIPNSHFKVKWRVSKEEWRVKSNKSIRVTL